MKNPDILKASVIVPTYSSERFRDVLEAVSSLLNQTYKNKEIIVVVDNNKGLFEKLKNSLPPSVKLILSQNPGASNARNVGLKEVEGNIIAFIDDDVFVEKNWLSQLVNNYHEANVIGAGGCLKPFFVNQNSSGLEIPEELYWIIGCTYDGFSKEKSQVRNNFGGNFSFRKEVFGKLSFSFSFQNTGNNKSRGTEDTELCIKVSEVFKNSKIVYDPEAIAYHRIYPYRCSWKYLLIRAYSEGVSKRYLSQRYRKSDEKHILNQEHKYFKDIVTKFIPKRIRQIFLGKNISSNIKSITTVLLLTFAVVIGYLHGPSSS